MSFFVINHKKESYRVIFEHHLIGRPCFLTCPQLAKKIKLINDYIELEKVRLNFTKVVFNYSTDDGSYEIAPSVTDPAGRRRI